MKVKVDGIWYDPNEVPIMILLTEQDKINIATMLPDKFKYASYPSDLFSSVDEMLRWMESEDE